jgi:hypothetical protein
LGLLDGIPGFLFTLVVEKNIKSLFTTEDRTARQALADILRDRFGALSRDVPSWRRKLSANSPSNLHRDRGRGKLVPHAIKAQTVALALIVARQCTI